MARMVAAAGRERGVVLTAELARGGFDRHAVQRLIAGGRLVRLFRAAYSVNDPPLPLALELAALKLLGGDACLSHETAAWCLGALEKRPSAVMVTLPFRRAQSRAGLVVHYCALASQEFWVRDGLRMTTPARTAIDVAATSPGATLDRVVNELIAQRMTSAARLRAAALRARPRRGSARLLRALDGGRIGFDTRYRGENRLAASIRTSRVLPAPERNVWLYGWETDFYWPEAGFYVEVDGGAAHSTPAKFERDRRRDAELQLRGLLGQRVTWRQITTQTAATLARVEGGYQLAASRVTKRSIVATK